MVALHQGAGHFQLPDLHPRAPLLCGAGPLRTLSDTQLPRLVSPCVTSMLVCKAVSRIFVGGGHKQIIKRIKNLFNCGFFFESDIFFWGGGCQIRLPSRYGGVETLC